MLNSKSVIFLFILSPLLISSAVAGGEDVYDKYFYDVLDSMLKEKATGEYHTMDKIFDLVRGSKEKNRMLVELLDYYLGSASGEVMGEFITKEGDKIIPLLKMKRVSPLNCLPKYKAICADSIEARNSHIDELLEAIKKGVVLKAAD